MTKLKRQGVDFVFMKATEGATFSDPAFERNWFSARQNNLLRGAYHFFRPQIDWREQVENFCSTVGTVEKGDLPPVLDVENATLWHKLSARECSDLILEWLTAVEKRLSLSASPLIYLSPSFARDVLAGDQRLAKYRLWLAHYTVDANPRVPSPWRDWTFWQYTNKGTMGGIASLVDLDRFNGGHQELQDLLNQ